MVDNQHRKIQGFTEMTEGQILIINAIKANEAKIKEVIDGLQETCKHTDSERWLELARDNLETGFMYAVKAVARPKGQMGSLD